MENERALVCEYAGLEKDTELIGGAHEHVLL